MADSVVKLRIDDREYNNKLRDAARGMKALESTLRDSGKTFVDVDAKVLDYVRELGKMDAASTTAKGKIGEMGNAFTELSLVYKRMTEQEKASPVGQAMAQSLEQLRGRTIEAKNELAQLNKQLTDNSTVTEAAAGDNMNFDSVLQSLGSQFGINTNLLSGLTSGTLATTAAITAGIGAVVAATKAWIDYNDQLNRQNTVTTVTTGLSGKEADDLTLGMRALSNTYDVDFREAINAANTLIQQFGVSGSEALRLIQDGMQGMIAGDGGKLLSMIQQYAPSFRDAGIEASQLVAIIQNSEGGLFTDQNMNAIAMGIRNIRRMTDDTRASLKELGIDADGMASKLEDDTMNVFEALREVSTALDNVGSGSKKAGDVMQAVFGRSGFMAGTKLGEAIAQLNTNLEETKKQTGELGESFARLNDANLRLEQTMQDIFGMTGWEDMNNLLKTDLANTLNDVLTFMGDIKTSITEIGTSQGFNALCDVLDTLVIPKLMGVTTALKGIKGWLDGLAGGGSSNSNDYSNVFGDFIDRITGNTPKKQTKSQPTQEVKSSGWQWGQGWQPETPQGKSNFAQPVQTPPPPPQDGYKVTKDKQGNVLKEVRVEGGVETDLTKVKTDADAASVSIDGLKDKLKELKKQRDDAANAGNTQLRDTYNKQIKETQDKIKGLQGTATTPKTTTKKDTWKVVEMKPVETIDFTQRSIKDVQADMSKATRSYNEAGDEIGRAAAKVLVEKFKSELEGMKNEGDVTKGEMKDAYTHDFSKDLKGTDYDLTNVRRMTNKRKGGNGNDDRRGNDGAASMKDVQQLVGGVSSMASTLQQIGIELPEGLQGLLNGLNGITSILTGISAIVTAIQTITTAQTFKFWATGGIVHAADGYAVPGNWGYDAVPSMLTSGELVLNRAQQGNLASQLEGARSAQASGASTPYLRGEDIYLGVNNFLRRSGRGEIVTSKR